MGMAAVHGTPILPVASDAVTVGSRQRVVKRVVLVYPIGVSEVRTVRVDAVLWTPAHEAAPTVRLDQIESLTEELTGWTASAKAGKTQIFTWQLRLPTV